MLAHMGCLMPMGCCCPWDAHGMSEPMGCWSPRDVSAHGMLEPRTEGCRSVGRGDAGAQGGRLWELGGCWIPGQPLASLLCAGQGEVRPGHPSAPHSGNPSGFQGPRPAPLRGTPLLKRLPSTAWLLWGAVMRLLQGTEHGDGQGVPTGCSPWGAGSWSQSLGQGSPEPSKPSEPLDVSAGTN